MGYDASLEHAKMLMFDVVLRLSMVCGDHRCDELLYMLLESETYLEKLVSRHKYIKMKKFAHTLSNTFVKM